HHRDWYAGFLFEELGKQGKTIHHGHLEVGEDRVYVFRGEQLERTFTVLGRNYRESARAIERATQRTAYEIVIVYQEKVRQLRLALTPLFFLGLGLGLRLRPLLARPGHH